jgi:hypothetical protein
MAERAELGDEESEEDLLEKLTEEEESDTIVRDFYIDEALAITADYVNLIHERPVAKVN